MSAIATKIVEKYNLSSEMSLSDLSQYTSEFLENLTDDRKRNQARRRLRDGFKFSSEQVSILIPNQRSGKNKVMHEVVCSAVNLATSNSYQVPDGCQIPDPTPQKLEETIGDMAQRILRDKLSIRDVRAEAYAFIDDHSLVVQGVDMTLLLNHICDERLRPYIQAFDVDVDFRLFVHSVGPVRRQVMEDAYRAFAREGRPRLSLPAEGGLLIQSYSTGPWTAVFRV